MKLGSILVKLSADSSFKVIPLILLFEFLKISKHVCMLSARKEAHDELSSWNEIVTPILILRDHMGYPNRTILLVLKTTPYDSVILPIPMKQQFPTMRSHMQGEMAKEDFYDLAIRERVRQSKKYLNSIRTRCYKP